jgi:phosphatidylserine decarboxylase
LLDSLYRRGDELGYFAFGGSTCVTVYQKATVAFDEDLILNSNKPIETLVMMGDHVGISVKK